MEKVNSIIPDWISRQASLGGNVKVDADYNLKDRFYYLLTVCCPLIFERYAIVLHPFWINYSIKNLVEANLAVSEEIKKKYNFTTINWPDFFLLNNKFFRLDSAAEIQEEIRRELIKETWPEYVWFPGEGDIENKQLIKIRNEIIENFGDIEVNNYYCLLKTVNWEEDVVYKGKLSELELLWSKDDIRDNPTAIFPDSKDWCIITDYDLDITYIGGSKLLIEKLTQLKELDIYPINLKYSEKKN